MLYQLEHFIITFCTCLVVFFLNLSTGVYLTPLFFFLGRELAQAEYRYIEQYGKGLRANLPWYGSLLPKVWDFHSFFWNLILPVLVSLFFYFDGVSICYQLLQVL